MLFRELFFLSRCLSQFIVTTLICVSVWGMHWCWEQCRLTDDCTAFGWQDKRSQAPLHCRPH